MTSGFDPTANAVPRTLSQGWRDNLASDWSAISGLRGFAARPVVSLALAVAMVLVIGASD